MAKTPTIRKFNPGTFQSDEEVIRQFVVREQELGVVLDVLRGNTDSRSCQHILVVAPRGRGKTMLLARVAAELRTGSELSQRLLPVRFMEESQEVFDIADFWLETLFYLSREVGDYDPEFGKELRVTHADLTTRWQGESLAERARAVVLDASDRLGRKLVLMVENLQTLCADVDEDFGWQLRETLQTEPQIMLICTATSCFKGMDEAQEPFFELFRTAHLDPLGTEACRRLWHMISGDEVTKRNIRPLEILTGGSPRLLVIVAEFARHRSFRKLMEELVTLVDDHTEYFRGHLEALAPAERRVYLAVIDLWQPSSTSEIAARARMDVRSVSSLLGRLINRGAVISQGKGRKREYVAAERLYSIYYKMRRERDEAAVVHNLIRFMAVFYGEGELFEMSNMLSTEAAQWPSIREGLERARAELPEIDHMLRRREWAAKDQSTRSALIERLEAELKLEREINFAATMVNEGHTLWERGDYEAEIAIYDLIIERFAERKAPKLREWVAIAMVNKGFTQEEIGEYAAALKTYGEVVRNFGKSNVLELQVQTATALVYMGMLQGEVDDYKAEAAAYNDVIQRYSTINIAKLNEWVGRAMFNKGNAQRRAGDLQSAIVTYDLVVERFGVDECVDLQEIVALALVYKGIAQGEAGEFEEGMASYDEVIQRFGASNVPELQVQIARAMVRKGIAQGEIGESATEIMTYDEVIQRFGGSEEPELRESVARAMVYKGMAQGEIGESEAEIMTYDEVIQRFGNSDEPELRESVARAMVYKGMAQGEIGESEAEIMTYDAVIQRFDTSIERELQEWVVKALMNKGDAQQRSGNFKAAIVTYDYVVERFSSLQELAFQREVVEAMISKGVAQTQQNDSLAAISTYDLIVVDHGDSVVPDIQICVGRALVNKGNVHRNLGNYDLAISTYDVVLDRFSRSDVRELQGDVIRALLNKAECQNRIGLSDNALRTCDELESRLCTWDNKLADIIGWWAMWQRTWALLNEEKQSSATDLFRTIYMAFDAENEAMMSAMQSGVSRAIGLGASERTFLDILLSDEQKAETLAPLVVALCIRLGEKVRAPAEVLEVAEDIIRVIEEE